MIDVFLIVLSLPFAFQAVFVFVETLAHFRCRQNSAVSMDSAEAASAVILIPAHDEEVVIADTLAALNSRLGERDRILVVADNCQDRTAAIARDVGVEVIERRDPQHRGKGYALDFGIRYLERNDTPDILIILDADCRVSEDAIARLKVHVCQSGSPAQALYLMKAPVNPDIYQKLAAFAWFFRVAVRFLGDCCLGLPSMILGSGMACRFKDAAALELASGEIVEDMQMSLDLAAQGKYPKLLYDAQVESTFPVDTQAQNSQRTRWEHGHLDLIFRRLPVQMTIAIRQRNPKLLGLVLSMGVLPLTLLAMSLVILLAISAVAFLVGATAFGLWVNLLATSLFALAILLAWLSGGREILSLCDLLRLPAYVLRKLPLYRRFLTHRETRWIRTERK